MPRRKKAAPPVPAPKKRSKPINLLKGFKDILPSEQKYWDFFRDAAKQTTKKYSFTRVDTPILEPLNLFVRAVGKQTDVVEKELYSFTDKGKEQVVIRPEGTASVVRAYEEHGMFNLRQPQKLFYIGPMFRHDKPQSGRYRQFHQLGLEVIGEKNPAVDAHLIVIARDLFKRLKLDIKVQVNSIGCPECRAEYMTNLINYYKAQKTSVCEDCKKRLNKSPLRLLDCKEEKCQPIKEQAPQIVDFICEDCKNHFMAVLEYLDEVDIEYDLNPKLVRGLDYYTNTVFEFFEKDDQNFKTALGGGGRYDGLMELLGGRDTPGCGLALGIERIINKIKEKEIKVPKKSEPQVFLAQIGEQAKRAGMVLFEELYDSGIDILENFAKDSLKSQLDLANKRGVKLVLILGQREVVDGTILIRDMINGVQEIIPKSKIVDQVKKKIIELKDKKVDADTIKEIKMQEPAQQKLDIKEPAKKVKRTLRRKKK